MDFDRMEYQDFETAVHKDTSEQTSETYHVFYLKLKKKKIKNIVEPWQTKPHYSTDPDIQKV